MPSRGPFSVGRGHWAEADLFSIMKRSPYVLRSFEFAPFDGAVDLDARHAQQDSWAERLGSTADDVARDPSSRSLLPFDIKSFSCLHEENVYLSALQLRHAAFFLILRYANPGFVDLVPNLRQEALSLELCDGGPRRYILLTPSTPTVARQLWQLEPSTAPYRMPVGLLNEAVRRLRDCALGSGDYVNPWTGVGFPGWRPLAARDLQPFLPHESSAQYTSFRLVWRIYRELRANPRHGIRFDLINLQPRLADFKLIIETESGLSQVFVQHKYDSRVRSALDDFDRAPIGRLRDGIKGRYFTAYDRFDFLIYEFERRASAGKIDRFLYILPEFEIPDEFYTCDSLEASFNRTNFHQYRVHHDKDGAWIGELLQIVRLNPVDRARRPRRPLPPPRQYAFADQEDEDEERQLEREGPSDPIPFQSQRGRFLARAAARTSIVRGLLAQCATRRSGLVLTFAKRHPLCDFAFCRYIWTQREADTYLASGIPPALVHSLPRQTPLVPFYIRSEHYPNHKGPCVTEPLLRRLNSSTLPRLLLGDLFLASGPPSLIPSDHIRPTQAQFASFARNGDARQLEVLLASGLHGSDYILSQGSDIYEAVARADFYGPLWSILDRLLRREPVQHPAGRWLTKCYVHSLQVVQQALADADHSRFGTPPE